MRCLQKQNPSVALHSIHQSVSGWVITASSASAQVDQSRNIIIMKWRMLDGMEGSRSVLFLDSEAGWKRKDDK